MITMLLISFCLILLEILEYLLSPLLNSVNNLLNKELIS